MFSQSQLESYISSITGTIYTVPVSKIGLMNYYFTLYESQLEQLNIFNVDDIVTQRDFEIAYCNLDYLPIPLFETITKVEKFNKITGVSIDLTNSNKYYQDIRKIDGLNYILALNFKCLSCNCECEVIRITGKYGIKPNQNLINFIYSIIYENLQSNNSVPSSSSNSCCDDLESINAGSIAIKFKNSTTQAVKTTTTNPNDLFSYSSINSLIVYYLRHFTIIY